MRRNKKKKISLLVCFICTISLITNCSAYTFSNKEDNPKLKCVSYHIWDENNSYNDHCLQTYFDPPDTIYIGGVQYHEDVFLMKVNKTKLSLDPLNCSVYKWGGNNSEDFGKFLFDSTGNLYITGTTRSFGAGSYDIFLTKYDPFGKSLWNRTWGYSGRDTAMFYEENRYREADMALDSKDNIYVTGLTGSHPNTNLCIIKYNSTGTQLWNRTWGGINKTEYPHHILIDENDYIYIAGDSVIEHFLLCYDKFGNLIWEKVWEVPFPYYGRSYMEYALLVGDHILFGESLKYENSCDFVLRQFNKSGIQLHNLTLSTLGSYVSFGEMIENSKNEVIFYGYYDEDYIPGSYSGGNLFIGRYDLQGNWSWLYGVDNSGDDYIYDISLDSSDNIYFCGSKGQGSNQDMYMLKFSSEGKLIWDHAWGSEERDYAISIIIDDQENIYVVGEIYLIDTIIAQFELISDTPNQDDWFIVIIVSIIAIVGIAVFLTTLIMYKKR